MRTRLILALLGTAVCATGAERPPFYLDGGWGYPAHGDTRNATTPHGYHVGAGYADNETGLVGYPAVDFDWTHCSGQGESKMDVYSIDYAERVPISDGFYVGAGLGTFYEKVNVVEPDGSAHGGNALRIGGRAMAGIGVNDMVFVEGTYFYSGKIGGVETSVVAVCLGIWF